MQHLYVWQLHSVSYSELETHYSCPHRFVGAGKGSHGVSVAPLPILPPITFLGVGWNIIISHVWKIEPLPACIYQQFCQKICQNKHEHLPLANNVFSKDFSECVFRTVEKKRKLEQLRQSKRAPCHQSALLLAAWHGAAPLRWADLCAESSIMHEGRSAPG